MKNFCGSENQFRAALLIEMGYGKKLTSIAVSEEIFLLGKIKKLLIVCLLSIVDIWKEELLKFADFDYELSVLKVSTQRKIEQL